MKTVIETERLILRRLTPDDAPFILELLNDPDFLRFIGDKGVRTLEDARGYISNGPMASYEQHGFGMYLTQLKESGAAIGMCGLLRREMLADPDIGFAFLADYRRSGYGFESAAAVLAQGRRDFGMERIVAVVSPDNEGSIKLLKKLGLDFESTVRLSEDGDELLLYGPKIEP